MPCHAMPCNATLCDAMPCNATQCHAMRCYAMLCDAMRCYAMLCYAIGAPLEEEEALRGFVPTEVGTAEGGADADGADRATTGEAASSAAALARRRERYRAPATAWGVACM